MVVRELKVSERRSCKTIGQIRSTQRYKPVENPEQEKLELRVVELASEYGRYGYRQVTDLLQIEGWHVGKDRVYSIWQREGLKVPQKQPKRSRLWLTDGSCIRLRPEFIAIKLVAWIKSLEVQPLFIQPGSPWENGYCESFNGKMRYELLDGEIFYSLLEAKILIERWRVHYNTKRPHSSLGGSDRLPINRST